MSPEDLLLCLCLHLRLHTFETSLTQIWNLAEILNAPLLPIDWPRVWERAREWRLMEAVNIALHLVTVNLGVPTKLLSNWTPDASLEKHLLDVLSRLGRFPHSDQISGHRVALLLSTHSSWVERYRALKDGALPPRAEIRAVYGQPSDGFRRDCLSYFRHWRHLWRIKGRAVANRLCGISSITAHIDHVAALRRHLDANRR